MQLFTEDEIKQFDLKTTKHHLDRLLKEKIVNLPLIENTELLAQADAIANQICYLEDHHRYCQMLAALQTANQSRWSES